MNRVFEFTSCDRAADFANLPGFAKLKAFGLRSGKSVSAKEWGPSWLTSSVLLPLLRGPMRPVRLIFHLVSNVLGFTSSS
jgi:hypothetical protein